MGTSGWSTQQLAEFVAAVSAAENEASAATRAVERAAEALDAAVAAIVCDGRLIASVGYPNGTAPIGELEAVKPGFEGSTLEVPGSGACPAAAAALEHPPGATLVIAREAPHGLSREETSLLRGMARVASMTMRMLRVLDEERAAREEVERLAQDQAALRRVATLVARASPREVIYAAVAGEIAQRLGAEVAVVLRFEANETATIVGGWGVPGLQIPTGAELTLAGQGVASSVWRTRRAARVERFDGPPGSVAGNIRSLGFHIGVGSPIFVDDDLWGVAFAATARQGALLAGSEERIAEFTQLVAAAIANAEARGELRRVADEQTALRRVATLVARGVPAGQVFDAVTSETRRILDFDTTFLYRLEPEGVVTVVAVEATLPVAAAVGDRWTPVPGGVVERVVQTGRPARNDGHEDEPGSLADRLREFGYGGAAAAPIVVEGRLWGVMSSAWAIGRSVPAGSEARLMQFSELIATALANAEAREELRRVAEEQAALRRVATRVARGEPPSAVFAAVAAEVGRVVPVADVAYVGRYERDEAIEFVGAWSRKGEPSFVGSRVALGGRNVATLVFEGNEPARVDRIPEDHAPATALARNWARSSAGAPINVEGRLWGVMTVGAAHEDELPPGTEYTLAQFTELVATAVANAQAREELRLVADEQAALRRVATLVARAAPAAEVFATVAEEVGRLLSVDAAAVRRCHADADEIVAAWSSRGEVIPVGFRRPAVSGTVTATVRETRRPARVDRYSAEAGRAAREMGIRSSVAVPITVEGELWGLIAVVSTSEEPPPPGTEERLAGFTELVGTAIANAQAREELRTIANEQAALRRVAVLVAAGAPPADVFAAVADEIGRLLAVEGAFVVRYESDDTVTILAGGTTSDRPLPIGLRTPVTAPSLGSVVRETGRPARIDHYAEHPVALQYGVRSSAAAPITVQGRLWGYIGVTSTREEPPPGTEARLAAFTEIAATAIANSQAREELRTIADEQAALRRVATLVAGAALPADVFAAVAEEVGRLLAVDAAAVRRYLADDTAEILAQWSRSGEFIPVGPRAQPVRGTVTATVRETRRPARVDRYRAEAGRAAREIGIRSAVGVPITVEGELWGLIAVVSTGEEPPPPGTEERLAGFTELVATAIANAQARADLAASRTRIVASADETRRKIERDLHDGAQQRLVTLALQLREAQAAIPLDHELAAELDRVAAGLNGALDELRELARGIHPPILAEGGLKPALKMLARRSAVPVDLDVRMDSRPPEPIEVGAFYVVSEALTNAVKHSEATTITVDVAAGDDWLRVRVEDDGVGGAEFAGGSGLVGLRDRVEALGGRIALRSKPSLGTSVSVELPLSPDPAALASR